MKGIILAGGSATRLYPITKTVSKQILPVYDKPMIYYPLSVLMFAGIREVLIISTERDLPMFENLLGDGSKIGMSLSYLIQDRPKGIADAFILGEKFIDGDKVCLILGDNIFYGQNLPKILANAANCDIPTVFGYLVKNPGEYGVVEYDANFNVISIEEKPENPKSNYAIPGIYFYPPDVVHVAKNLTPSARGELEVTDINKYYLSKNNLKVELLGRGFAWLDTGSPESLLDAANYVALIQKRQGMYISCIEEIAYRQKFITRDQLLSLAAEIKTEYGKYLIQVADSL